MILSASLEPSTILFNAYPVSFKFYQLDVDNLLYIDHLGM